MLNNNKFRGITIMICLMLVMSGCGTTESADPDSNLISDNGPLGSWDMGGTDDSAIEGNDYAYNCALYVTSEGIDTDVSNTNRISAGEYDDAAAENIVINDSASGHNGVLLYNTPFALTNAEITMLTDADGSDTCDFSGKGSAIAAFGSDSYVTVDDSDIHTSGVATMPVFADDGAVVTVRNSTLRSDGGTLYKDYLNTPSQSLMVAPPWVLGIMGTSRCTNLMGTNTVMNFIDSDTSAGAWAVLSTDAGNDMALNVYNTSLTLNNDDESKHLLQAEDGQIYETKDDPYTEDYGSGYGTYLIGNAKETFAGAEINVGTYASIFTGGSAVFRALKSGEQYELTDADGNVVETYTAAEDKATSVHSDTFGFMSHQSTNNIEIEEGTKIDSGFATFLVKTGSANEELSANTDGAVITNGGVLIQVMDNDDTTNGGMMDSDDEANTNGGSQNFKTVHSESAGFNTDEAQASSQFQDFTFTNGSYSGNIYNASGADGLEGSALYVTFGSGADFKGAAAATSAIHVTYDGSVSIRNNGGAAFDDAQEAADFAEKYQNTEFDITEYWSIGQVANMICDNGANNVYIVLTDDAVWNVADTSLISGLSVSGDAKVVIPEGVTLTVGGVDYTNCTLTSSDNIAAGVSIPEHAENNSDGPGGGAPDGNGGPGGDGQKPPEMPGD